MLFFYLVILKSSSNNDPLSNFSKFNPRCKINQKHTNIKNLLPIILFLVFAPLSVTCAPINNNKQKLLTENN